MDQEQLIGCINGINLSDDLAFIGQYAVLPEYQGKGVGSALWKAVMKHIGTERNISLSAYEKMFANYRDRSNFSVIPKKCGLWFSGKFNSNQLIEGIDGISVLPISEDNIEKVIQYDREVCGIDRSQYIRELSKIDEYVNRVALNEKDQVLGYCVVGISIFNTGMVAPLYADDETIAELLVENSCLSSPFAQNNGILYQCWDVSHKSIEIANKLGLQVIRRIPILFTKRVVEGNMDKIFCTSSRHFFPF